ncbi:MAG: hybrid sensor histidine kinase/response regulator [Kordiimonadales bacterium]|nr:MAG: hybrid sensor histidine kinase/response regulator [Kordiimonadales bacterium]
MSADVSLFDRMGGEDAIAVASHLIGSRLANHKELGTFFGSVPADQRKAKFMGLMLALFKDDIDAAENVGKLLVSEAGFGDDEFDALMKVMTETFTECQVAEEVVNEAIMTFELVREAITASSNEVVPAVADKPGEATGPGAAAPVAGAPTGGPSRATQSIRVSVDLLEDLMNMVSELVLTRNQLLQITREMDNSELAAPLQRLSQCTTELQENVMKTRMQPIGNAWAKLPRVVRDLTVELDKKIELEMVGSDTELDRQVLELIKDPLTHMVRNSADHAIESPAERIALGKTEHGTITLKAYHEGGHIILEIKDDGRGIDAQKLLPKIIEKGLATAAELADMSEGQIQKFIFNPGFSTAEKVTSVSGRGVGMDVVRSNIEKIGGTIDMVSIVGKGSTFKIKIPLTLAIVAGLIVKAKDERYAIPQISVLELVRASANSEHRIENIKDTPVLRLRNRLLPLVYLNEILGLNDDDDDDDDEREKKDDFIVVSQVGPFTFGIVVDRVFDTEEIVVKPLAPILKDIEIFSGNTILGDGSVIMILDPNGIAALTSADASDHEDEEEQEREVKRKAASNTIESVLVFTAGVETPKAVPLGLVARLEEIDVEDVEISDGKYLVQYREQLMPLIFADPSMKMMEKGRQPVLVFTDREYTMGLVVDTIRDIVEDELDIKLASEKPGVVGSAVINGKATEVIDVAHYLGLAFSDWLNSGDTNDATAPTEGAHLLLVDDSDFFRNMLKPVLTVAGYDVVTVNSGAAAIALRDDGHMFDLIVSDIEMPDMDGFELAQNIRSEGIWQDLPLIALSALASARDINRGHEAGFDDYVAKFDKETLLRSLSQQLQIKGTAA